VRALFPLITSISNLKSNLLLAHNTSRTVPNPPFRQLQSHLLDTRSIRDKTTAHRPALSIIIFAKLPLCTSDRFARRPHPPHIWAWGYTTRHFSSTHRVLGDLKVAKTSAIAA
jgi:hypothetical protein